jgi:aspartate racemase
MPLHIGIVACSAEGAALCYRTVCVEGAHVMGRHDHPEVSMHTHSLAEYMKCVDGGDWMGVAELMLSSARKLASVGADFLICPDNTIHQALALVEPRSPPALAAHRRRRCQSGRRTRLPASRADGHSLAGRQRHLSRTVAGARRGLRACDAVILGCTEIPLIMSDANSPLPTLDSTRLLARAALQRAVQSPPEILLPTAQSQPSRGNYPGR